MSISCPLCDAASAPAPYLRHERYAWVRCAACRFVYQEPYIAEHKRIATDAGISQTYEAFVEGSLAPSVTREKCDWVLSASVAKTAYCIEIGPGRGELLSALREARPAWSFLAIEPHPPFQAQLKTQGFSVLESLSDFTASAALAALATESGQVIVIADNVLEHLEYPVGVLTELRRVAERLMVPLVALVEVPNEKGLAWRQGLQDWLRGFAKPPTFPGHINLFTHLTLRFAAKRAGFANIHVRGHGLRTREQLEYLLRDKVRSHLAPLVVRGLSVVPMDAWFGLCYWLRGSFRFDPQERLSQAE